MKIYAHRGFSHKFPEATRAAYEAAIGAGADGLECDIRLTSDLVPICFHDRNTKRIAGVNLSIALSSLSKLRSVMDLLTLEELLQLAQDHQSDLLIETKHPVRHGRRVERSVIELLQRYKVQATTMSFSLVATLRFKRELSDVAYVVSRRWRLLWVPTEKVAIDIELFERSKWVRKRLQGRKVLLWTVNDERYLPKLEEWQIYGVITDRPDLPFRLR